MFAGSKTGADGAVPSQTLARDPNPPLSPENDQRRRNPRLTIKWIPPLAVIVDLAARAQQAQPNAPSDSGAVTAQLRRPAATRL